MNVHSLLLVGMNPRARAVIVEAARLACPGASLSDVATVDEALKKNSATSDAELLLLCEPDQAALAQALAATDPAGDRRWAIVVFGADASEPAAGVATLPPEDWEPRWVAQTFRASVRAHVLARENAHLRGDLSTVGRRISHDLRTPLAAVYSACEALKEITPDQKTDLTMFTDSIATSSDELMHLIGRLSLILKASAESFTPELVSMDEIVFATLQRLEARILRQGATVTKPASWPKVRGVEHWLEAIWLNLVTNALQHAGPKPQIELGWNETPGAFRFWVNDHGPGVPPEKICKLFFPFDQLHRLNAPRGLGLPLVQRLVELQGGACGYELRASGGAHFYFTLPVA